MRNENYQLVVYCDECCPIDGVAIRKPRDGHYFGATYHGTNRMEAHHAAKKRGWKIGEKDICPDCVKINEEGKKK